VKLNDTIEQPNLFMIHPGWSSCVEYREMAAQLSSQFSCYGVDSYNLFNDKKIDKLADLAKYYLKFIKKIMKQTKQTEYYFLGWCLGGLISMEIASLLEREGISNIKLYILDTVYKQKEGFTPGDQDFHVEKNYLLAEGFSKKYIKSSIDVLKIESKFASVEISKKLQSTKIILYKAFLRDPTYDAFRPIDEESQNVINKIKYNNIDEAINNLNQLQLIKLKDVHHSNILEHIVKLDK
jgi:hypothetical protein